MGDDGDGGDDGLAGRRTRVGYKACLQRAIFAVQKSIMRILFILYLFSGLLSGLFLASGLFVGAAPPAYAQGLRTTATGAADKAANARPDADFTALKHTGSGKIDKAIDGHTLLLSDGRLIRLAALHYPFETGQSLSGSMVAAHDYLEKLLPAGTQVLIYQTRSAKTGRINRMGHDVAHLVIKDDGRWINGLIVAAGLAYAATDTAMPEMAAQLYQREDAARGRGLNLWAAHSVHGLLHADRAEPGIGAFRVVEGTVHRAAMHKNNLFLNYGPDWRSDFTVMISADLRRRLSRAGIDPLGLAGQEIRVRGWLRSWNGPYMTLQTPEHLEILSPASTPLAPAPPAP